MITIEFKEQVSSHCKLMVSCISWCIIIMAIVSLNIIDMVFVIEEAVLHEAEDAVV